MRFAVAASSWYCYHDRFREESRRQSPPGCVANIDQSSAKLLHWDGYWCRHKSIFAGFESHRHRAAKWTAEYFIFCKSAVTLLLFGSSRTKSLMLTRNSQIYSALGQAAVMLTSSPYMAISYPFLALLLYVVQRFYLRTSRQLRLLDLEAKSPL